MIRQGRRAWTALLAGASVIALAACGSSSSSSSSATSSAASSNGTITQVTGTAPDSLDPGMAYTTQALEPDQVVYTPLLVYAHLAGAAGGHLIAGLATALPTISSDGKTYTLTLRKRPQVLKRHPGRRQQLHLCGRARAEDPVGRLVVHHGQRRRRQRVRDRQGHHDLGDHDRRRHRQDHDQADCAVRRVRQRARVPGVRPSAEGHAVQERAGQPAPGSRPVQVHQRRPERLLLGDPQSALDVDLPASRRVT